MKDAIDEDRDMYFVICCTDKPDRERLRLDHRQAHLDRLARLRDRVLAAGPTLADDGQRMNGSLLIIDFADRSEAEAFVAEDPYTKAGLFESVVVRPWRKVLPTDR